MRNGRRGSRRRWEGKDGKDGYRAGGKESGMDGGTQDNGSRTSALYMANYKFLLMLVIRN